jgi:hypothetical protein
VPTAEQLARGRDLKVQMKELAGESDQEIIFRETSPPKRRVTLYSRVDGEPLQIPVNIAERALEKQLPDGSFMFTTDPNDAPEYKMGTIKCFLHEESAERMSGALDEVGLTGIICPAGKLSSLYSKRIHAQHRHRQQWEAYQEHINDEKARVSEARQEAQLNATLALAGRAAEAPAAVYTCAQCGKTFDSHHKLNGHRAGAHTVKEKANAGSPPLDETQQ